MTCHARLHPSFKIKLGKTCKNSQYRYHEWYKFYLNSLFFSVSKNSRHLSYFYQVISSNLPHPTPLLSHSLTSFLLFYIHIFVYKIIQTGTNPNIYSYYTSLLKKSIYYSYLSLYLYLLFLSIYYEVIYKYNNPSNRL